MSAGIEQQRHQTAADHERENDPEPHRDVSAGRYWRAFDCVPGIDRKPEREGEQGDERHDDKEASHRSTYFGCTPGLPPGEPGGGMTFIVPPSGGFCCIPG